MPINIANIRPPAAASRDGGTVDAWTVVYFFHENAGLIFLSLLLGLVASLAYLVRTTPVYTARAVLEVANAGPSPLDGPAGRDDPVAADSATLLKTVEQSLTGPGVLDRVIATEQLALDPYFVPPGTQPDADGLRDRLQKCVSAQLIRGTRLIAVTAESPDPARASRLAQALVDAFFAKNVSARRAEAEASRRFLLAEVERQSAVLKGAEERLQAYRETSGAGAFPNQRDLDAGYLTQLHAQLSDATSQRVRLESLHAQVTAALRSGDVNQLLSLQPIADSPEIVELRKQADEVATRLAILAGRYRPKHPAMLEAQRTLDETRAALDRTARRSADAIVHAYQAARDTAEKLQRELAAQERQSVELARVGITYRELEREVATDAAVYQQLLARLKESDALRNLLVGHPYSGGLVRLVEQPGVPDEPSRPRMRLVLPAGLLAGGLLGCALALLRRMLDDTVPSVDAAEACLGVATLAVVPQSRQIRFRRGRARLPHPGQPDLEPFRSLRTTIALLRDDAPGRALMFTSAVPGEGKSCCSIHYATVVAQSGLRTLLIDGDLRRPRLRRAFNLHKLNPRPEVAACLLQPEQLAAAVEPTPVPNLFLLGSSHGSPLASELLAGGHLAALLEQSLARFDRVIVDTAPVAVVSDALHFARHIPAVCLVVQARRTPRRIIRRACDLLAQTSGRPLTGVVLNQIRRDRASGYHYYYHGGERYALTPG